MSPVVRPATKADIIAYNGVAYKDSFRGIVAEMDGEILGIAGVLHTMQLQAFSSMDEKLRKYPKTIIIAAREFRKILNAYERDIYAIASEKYAHSGYFLEYVGFKPYQERIYKWQQQL